jgi:hypothetical protein
MHAFLEKLLAWYLPPAPRLVFASGPIARGLAQMRSVGCAVRSEGKCPHESELFGCADCEITPPTSGTIHIHATSESTPAAARA